MSCKNDGGFPLFSAYAGGKPAGLGDTKSSGVALRIASVWPFLVRKVLKFQTTLRPRERANFDAEDTLMDLWIELAEKDDLYRPDQGRYITFAGMLADHLFSSIRAHANPVELPRNSLCRLRNAEVAGAGGLSPRRTRTVDRARSARGDFQPVEDYVDDDSSGPDRIAEGRDEVLFAKIAVVEAMSDLEPVEVAILSRTGGLWAGGRQSADQIAFELDMPTARVIQVRARANRRLRAALRRRRLGDDGG